MQINNTYIIGTDPPSIGWVTLKQKYFNTY